MPCHHTQHVQNVGPNLFTHNEKSAYVIPHGTANAVTSCTLHSMCMQASQPPLSLHGMPEITYDLPFDPAVRRHLANTDAQSDWRELSEHYFVCKDDDFSVLRAIKIINENFGKCTMMYTRSTWNGIDCCNNPMHSLLVAT